MHDEPQLLIRAAIHDIANAFTGIRAILDRSQAQHPMAPRDRERLDAVITEGLGTLERARCLAMGTLPDSDPVPGSLWRDQMAEKLKPLELLFRSSIRITGEGDPALDAWPGECLQGYVKALTRQVLPHQPDKRVDLHFAWDAREWRIRWSGASPLPSNLLPAPGEPLPDIATRWADRCGRALEARLHFQDGTMEARLPRP